MAESPFGPRVLRKVGAPPQPPPVDDDDDVPPPPPPPRAPPPQAPRGLGPASGSTVGGAKRAPLDKASRDRFATVIQRFARVRLSNATMVRPRQVLACALVIQEEYRAYLVRTRYNRNALRQRRAAAHQQFLRLVDTLLVRTRDNGRRIALEERDGRERLWAYHVARCVNATLAEEARTREETEAEEAAEYEAMCDLECPPEVRPGNLQHDELLYRNGIVRLWRAEWGLLMQRHIAMRAREQRIAQAVAREHIRTEEAAERCDMAAELTIGAAAARLREVQGDEARLRAAYDAQRESYATALHVQCLVAARTVVAVSHLVPEGEPFQRLVIDRARARELQAIFLRHLDGRLRLLTRELQDDESLDRRRLWRQETAQRGRIMHAVVGVHLQLLQRDAIDDVECEYGARTALRWAEQRARHALQLRLLMESDSITIPVEERHGRLAIARQERRDFLDIIRQTPVVDVLTAQEVAGRRRVFREWVEAAGTAIFAFARLQLMAAEQRRRRELLQLFELQDGFVTSAEYLWAAEVDDRATYRRSLERLTGRHHQLLAAAAVGGAGGAGSPSSRLALPARQIAALPPPPSNPSYSSGATSAVWSPPRAHVGGSSGGVTVSTAPFNRAGSEGSTAARTSGRGAADVADTATGSSALAALLPARLRGSDVGSTASSRGVPTNIESTPPLAALPPRGSIRQFNPFDADDAAVFDVTRRRPA